MFVSLQPTWIWRMACTSSFPTKSFLLSHLIVVSEKRLFNVFAYVLKDIEGFIFKSNSKVRRSRGRATLSCNQMCTFTGECHRLSHSLSQPHLCPSRPLIMSTHRSALPLDMLSIRLTRQSISWRTIQVILGIIKVSLSVSHSLDSLCKVICLHQISQLDLWGKVTFPIDPC